MYISHETIFCNSYFRWNIKTPQMTSLRFFSSMLNWTIDTMFFLDTLLELKLNKRLIFNESEKKVRMLSSSGIKKDFID